MRISNLERNTNETQIKLELNLDGNGKSEINTSVRFLDHMLELLTRFSSFNLKIKAKGDEVDNHHVVEDIGIVFGQALYQALGEKRGIKRFSWSFMPMDESLSRIVIDLSGRPYLVYEVELDREYIGDCETELFKEFFTAFTMNARLNLHITNFYGENNHHIMESIFKGLGLALKEAVKISDQTGKIPSTKGILE